MDILDVAAKAPCAIQSFSQEVGKVPTLFRSLSPDEEKDFKQWARNNYVVGTPISGVWHIVVQEECVLINREHLMKEDD